VPLSAEPRSAKPSKFKGSALDSKNRNDVKAYLD